MKYRFILLLFLGFIFAQDDDLRELPDVVTKVATSAGNWLKLETGARGIAMSGAMVAAGNDVSAIPYNPASISFIQGRQVYYSKTNYLVDVSHNVLGFGMMLSPSDFLGLHVFYLDSGEIIRTTALLPAGSGTYRVSNLAVRISYARQLSQRLYFGMTGKLVRESIAEMTMQTFVLDVGSNFDTGLYGMKLGMSVSNFGPSVQFKGDDLNVEVDSDVNVDSTVVAITKKFSLPMIFRVGLANELIGPNGTISQNPVHSLIVSADAVNPIDYVLNGSAGFEYAWNKMAFLRMGQHFNHDTAGFSFGAGVLISNISVDYAFAGYGILNNTHQFALGYKF